MDLVQINIIANKLTNQFFVKAQIKIFKLKACFNKILLFWTIKITVILQFYLVITHKII